MKLTSNFSLKEFECTDGSQTPKQVQDNLKLLAKQLQVLRDYTGLPITVNSGYRSPEYNKKIGGASKSQHLTGKAADIVIKGIKPDEVYLMIEDLIIQGLIDIDGVGRYDTFTHIDIRGYKARWDNRKNK